MLTLCRRVLRFALASLVFGSYVTGSATAGTDCSSVRAQRGAMPSDVGLDATLRSDVADVNGTTLHYVWGGNGPAVVLLHGYPQDWTEWRHVIPELSRHFTVVAVDLRGIGGSKPTQGGYDAMNLAADIRGLVGKLELDRPYIAGHDIGGLVAYAYGRAYPDATRGVMVHFPALHPGRKSIANPRCGTSISTRRPTFQRLWLAGARRSTFVIS
jgi:pimeloyl-ACP methyl ester carboxylesterase